MNSFLKKYMHGYKSRDILDKQIYREGSKLGPEYQGHIDIFSNPKFVAENEEIK